MALIGVILLLIGAAGAVATYVAAQAAGGTIALTAFGFTRTASPLELAAYAAGAVLLIALGWALLAAAARHRARVRRDSKESARLAEVEEKAESSRLEHERRFEEAGMRDEDLRRRESELSARHEGLDSRESELTRREAEWREREGPSVADVVTGRADGSVHDGTASWSEHDGTDARSDGPAAADTEREAADVRDGRDVRDTRYADDADAADVPTERRTNA